MGFDYTQGATKKDIIARIVEQSKATAHTVKGNVLWTVEPSNGTPLIGCYLLGSSRGFGYGYKDMCESMHPYYYSCPLSYLEKAPETCPEWRAGVRKFHATAAMVASLKLKIGDKVKLKSGCSVPEVVVTSLKPLLAVANGKVYKLPKSYIAEVVA